MEQKEYQERNFKALTPSIVLSYLKFKQAYEDKNYIAVWDAIIPRYFTEASFCGHINSLREKRIEIANMGKEESKKAFAIAFDSLLWDKIKDKHIDAQEFKQLVGSLMSVYTSPKFKHFTQNYTQDIVHVLDQIHTEKDTKSQKKQEKIDKKNQKNGEANQKMENKMEQE